MEHFQYPVMPMYTHDYATYCRHMHEWHMKMVKYQEEKRTYHMERARHFQKLMGTVNVVPLERPKDSEAS